MSDTRYGQPPIVAMGERPVQDVSGYRLKRRLVGHHRIVDTGKLLDECRDTCAGVDQLAPTAYVGAVYLDDADFGNAVSPGAAAGGFNVDKGQGWVGGMHVCAGKTRTR